MVEPVALLLSRIIIKEVANVEEAVQHAQDCLFLLLYNKVEVNLLRTTATLFPTLVLSQEPDIADFMHVVALCPTTSVALITANRCIYRLVYVVEQIDVFAHHAN